MLDPPWEARQHEGYDYKYLWKQIKEHGVRVRTLVKWGTTLERPLDHQLLMIAVKPVETEGYYFPTARPPNPWSPWHVSICFNTDPHTPQDIHYIVKHFDNKTLHLRIRNTEHPTGTSLELDPENDPIASDPVVRRLFLSGSYGWKEGGIHISL